jgi:thiosulfate/3-mercaptopyruvate sulfurtransferase
MNRFLVLTVLFLIAGRVWAGGAVIDYVRVPPADVDAVLDVRSPGACSQGSLPGARCLPAQDFLAPHRRLANISGILWLLGTAGLEGDEWVLIIGDRGADREFMAGLLYLAGQKQISVLSQPVSRVAGGLDGLRPGVPRSRTREVVWQAPMRADRILLRSELQSRLAQADAPILIDGRSETEYWGQRIRGARGGHLPGAQHLAAASLSPASGKAFDAVAFGGRPVAYANDAYEGLIYLSRLLASGVDARLYLEGWVGWASDGALPVDSLTYPDVAAAGVAAPDRSRTDEARWPLVLMILLAAVLAVIGFQVGRRGWG